MLDGTRADRRDGDVVARARARCRRRPGRTSGTVATTVRGHVHVGRAPEQSASRSRPGEQGEPRTTTSRGQRRPRCGAQIGAPVSPRPAQPEPFLRGAPYPAFGDVPYPRANPSDTARLPADVWHASMIPVGVRLELVGDAEAVDVGYRTTTGNLGYRGEGAGITFSVWRGGHKVCEEEAVLGDGMVRLALGPDDPNRPATVYLPEGMQPVVLSVNPVGGDIQPAPPLPRWLAYGDSMTQGWIASSPSQAWTAITARKVGLDLVNLGYAGAARGEIVSAEHLAELPAEVVTIAMGANCWTRVPHSVSMVSANLDAFLNNDFGIEGVAEHAIPLKTIKNGELIRNKIMESVRNAVSAEHSGGSTNGKLTFTIIGGGASGVELAASTKEYVDSLLYDYKVTGLASRVILIEAQGHLMEGSGNAFSTRLESLLKESGIELLLNAKVTKVTEDEILLDNRNFIKTSNVFWTAGVKNSSVAAMMGGSHVNKKSGRIIVDQFLRIPGFENIAVIGDNGLVLTQVQNQYVPPTAAAAVQEGNYLGVRLASVVRERKNNVPFIYRDKGTMLSLGRFNGLYKLQNGFILSGFSAWLAWRLIHIIKISTFQNKVEVFSDWFSLTLHRRDVIRSH